MASKTLVNRPADAVTEAIDGLLLTRPDLIRLDGFPGIKVVSRVAIPADRVALISGGGSGHEPAHAGLVGTGLLTAAVCGDVFSSPNVAAILAAILHVAPAAAASPGVLLIIKNYTGDRLAFALAAEQARAAGIATETVYVADDAAVDGGKITGRRGLAGTVLVHKIAGALAEAGASLSAVAAAARAVAAAVVTVGASLTVCDIPGVPRSDRLDGAAAVELGLGIHGEPGAERLERPTADDLCGRLVAAAAARMLALRAPLLQADSATTAVVPVAALVNNLGGLSNLELAVCVRDVAAALDTQRFQLPGAAGGSSVSLLLQRLVVGPLMTSLDMRGLSVSLLPLDALATGLAPAAAMTAAAALDAPTPVPAWPAAVAPRLGADRISLTAVHPVPAPSAPTAVAAAAATVDAVSAETKGCSRSSKSSEDVLRRCALAACDAVEAAAGRLNELDAVAGDGDCGATFVLMAGAVRAVVQSAGSSSSSSSSGCGGFAVRLSALLSACSAAIGATSGGTSGILYALMLRAAANAAAAEAPSASPVAVSGRALAAGVAAVSSAANAAEGDRTMLDALGPAVRAMLQAAASDGDGDAGRAADAAARAAAAGADATEHMPPRAGRASYVSAAVTAGHPDAGAAAAAAWVAAVARAAQPMV